jgi:spore germination protein GerM
MGKLPIRNLNMTKKSKPDKVSTRKKVTARKKVFPQKKTSARKQESLLPLYIILIILVSLTAFMTFSSKSSFLSDIFSRNDDNTPLIERPVVEQNTIPKNDNDSGNNYTVTNEVEVKSETEPVTEEIDKEQQKSMKSRLFYVKVSDEGQISLKSVIRTVYYTTAPLTETMKSLIQGPERSELNKALLNLIPQNSVLNSVRISNGVAFMDFNEDFQFNSLGIEGYKAQLMQIIFTATEFQSVDKVQILINGEKSEYLGAEGVFIGNPIDRDYFNTF